MTVYSLVMSTCFFKMFEGGLGTTAGLLTPTVGGGKGECLFCSVSGVLRLYLETLQSKVQKSQTTERLYFSGRNGVETQRTE